jgi:hypothetical protein
MQEGDWRFSQEIFEVWNFYRDSARGGGLNRLMLDFIHMRSVASGKMSSNITLREAASRVLESYSDESVKSSDAPAEVTNGFRKEADDILKSPKSVLSNVSDPFKGFGRNDRIVVQYGSAIPVEKKFKQVESDLRNGQCVFLRLLLKSKE